MLKFGESQIIDGITVYQDDEVPGLFYALPQTPRFRIANDKPVFTFLKYREPIPRDDGSKGGGFLVCDVEFALSETEEQELVKKLQAQLDEKSTTRDLKNPLNSFFSKLRNRNLKARLGRLNFISGKATVTLLDSGGSLVEQLRSPAAPSLYGNMVLPITAELSQYGASVLEEALNGDGGVLQVSYELLVNTRLPDMKVHIHFDTQKTLDYFQKVSVGTKWRIPLIWSKGANYSETINELITEAQSGWAIVDPGEETKQELIQPMNDWARQTLSAVADKMLLEAIPAVDADKIRKQMNEKGGGVLGWIGLEEIVASSKSAEVNINRTRSAVFDQRFTQRQVFTWNVNPQGTLPNITTMKNSEGENYKWEDYCRIVDLNDPFFRSLKVSMRVNADFEQLPLSSVQVKATYKTDEKNTIIAGHVFTSPNDVAELNAYLDKEGSREYTYSYKVNYKSESKAFVSEEKKSDDPSLVVNVGDVGILDLRILPGDLNFEQVKSAQVKLWYDTHDRRIEYTASMDSTQSDYRWTKVIFEDRKNPVHYQVKYFMHDGREFLGPELTTGANEVHINDPFTSMRTVGVRGYGDFNTRIDTIFVDLSYVDKTNNYAQTYTVALTADDTFADWTFPAILPDGGELTYSANIRYKDGSISTVDKTPIEGTTVMVGDVQMTQPIEVMSDLIDFDVYKLVKVTLRYVDAANGIDETDDLVFKAGSDSTLTWEYPYKDKTKKSYQYKAVYFPAAGKPLTVTVTDTTEETIVLPGEPE